MDKKKIKKQTTKQVEYGDAQVDAFMERLRAFLRKHLRGIVKGLEGENVSAREAAKMLGGLETALKEAGLAEKLAPIREMFDREFAAVTEEFKATTGKTALLSAFTKKNLDTLVDDRLRMAGKVVEQYVSDVRSVVMDSVLAGKQITADDVLDGAEGATLRNIQTEIRTTLIAYNRITHLEKAKKAGVTKFLYVGPDDEVTRPFCQERVGQIFTLEEVESWDNGTELPANIYLGGYNCRHHLRPVSDELAAELEAEQSDEDTQ